jgi:hypothetical protein
MERHEARIIGYAGTLGEPRAAFNRKRVRKVAFPEADAFAEAIRDLAVSPGAPNCGRQDPGSARYRAPAGDARREAGEGRSIRLAQRRKPA